MRRASLTEGSAEELSRTLASVASDPSLTEHLHDVFGRYCHEFRNVLNSIRMSLYLARKSDCPEAAGVWSDLDPRYALVERFIDRFHQVCRPMEVTPVRLPLDVLFEDRRSAWSAVLARRGRRLIVVPPREPTPGAFDPMRLAAALDDLVDWRAHVGDPGSDLRAAWGAEGKNSITWDEPPSDRPVSPSKEARETEPLDASGAATAESVVLAALTVPMLSRVMAAHGGALHEDGPAPWRLTLRWPLDARPNLREAPQCSPSRPCH